MTPEQYGEWLEFFHGLGLTNKEIEDNIDELAHKYQRDDMDVYKDYIEEGQFRRQE